MEPLIVWLDLYGIIALFGLMLLKALGAPVPVPSEVIILAAAARAADGHWPLWQVFVAIVLGLVIGNLVQYAVVKGPGREALHRWGHYLGLTPRRLDALAARMRRAGMLGATLAVVMPVVRSGVVVGCGLAGAPWRTVAPALVFGNTLLVAGTLGIGYTGMTLLGGLSQAGPIAWLAALAVAVGAGAWLWTRRPGTWRTSGAT